MLGENRTERPAGHDDRTLGAERAAGAYADCRRNRFQHSNFGLDSTAIGQDGLDRLGHTVTTDLLRPEPRHYTDHQTAGDGCTQHKPPRMMLSSRGNQIDGPALVEDQVSDQPDQPQEAPGRSRCQRADGGGERCHQQHSPIDHEVRQSRAHEPAPRDVGTCNQHVTLVSALVNPANSARRSSTISAVSRT